ncbi:MAG: hypothetical protein U1F48_05765 [Burkholderiales bacterium]
MQRDTVTWTTALREAARSGTVASIVSTLVLVACGRREHDDAAQPMNGPSQWVWGRSAPYAAGFSARHTVVGYAIHHAMSILWAVLFERYRPRREAAMAATATAAAATAAVAAAVDFRIVPKRLSPGFEARLSRPALLAVYAGFAVGLASAACWRASGLSDRRRDSTRRY